MSNQDPEAGDHLLPEKTLKELYAQSRDRGRAGLPVMSLSMGRGLVPRNQDERRVETNLSDEQHRLVRVGELAYNMMRMWQGVCGLAQEDCLISPAYVVVRPLNGMDPKFSEYLLTYEETVAKFKRLSFGVVDDRLRLYFKDFERVRVRTPSPPVQRKVAKILTTIDNLIGKTETLIAKYQAIKQGMMHDLFTRGIDEDGHLRPTRAEAADLYKQTELGWVPKEWKARLLGEISEFGSGVTLGRKLSGSQVVELPYLRVANVQDGFLDLSEIKTVEVLSSEVDRFSIQPGDMLLTEGGDFDKLGRGSVWRGQIVPCLHQNHIFRVRPSRDVIVPDFLAAVTASSHGKRYFLVSSKQTTNLATINSTQLKAFPVPLPSLAEQERIVSRLSAVDRQIEGEQGHLGKLRQERTGLMQDLLTGKVRMKVDESEEIVALA